MRTETLQDGQVWLRIAEKSWLDPLDPIFAAKKGGRWNPPSSYPTLYLNEDKVTARLNLRHFIAGWPYEPEELRDDNGPVLVHATLPRNQSVLDVHTPQGVKAIKLPDTYPLDKDGHLIPHGVCQPIGSAAKKANLRGVRCRSARVSDRAGRELAWFPARTTSRARVCCIEPYEDWYWG
jgi:hypothetical protein